MKCILHSIKDLTKPRALFILLVLVFMVVGAGCSSKKNIRSENMRINGGSQQKFVSSTPSRNAQKVNADDKKTYKMALAMMEERNYSRAHDLFKRVSDNNPDLSGPFINMGIIALKQENNLQAESFFQQALKSKSDNEVVYNYLGIAYRQQGRFTEADTAYKMALRLDDTMAKTYLNLGILNDLYLGNYLEAQKHYLKYQQFDPDNKQVNAWLLDLNSRIQASAE